MNPKQERFVQEYLVDLNATQAAIRAGYSAKTACQQGERLLRNADISAAVSVAVTARSERTEITQDYVLRSIVETMERCKQAVPVLDRKGDPVLVETPEGGIAPAYTFNAQSVLKGCELLGRHLAMFTEKVQLDAKHAHTLEQAGLPEVLGWLGEAGRAIGQRPH